MVKPTCNWGAPPGLSKHISPRPSALPVSFIWPCKAAPGLRAAATTWQSGQALLGTNLVGYGSLAFSRFLSEIRYPGYPKISWLIIIFLWRFSSTSLSLPNPQCPPEKWHRYRIRKLEKSLFPMKKVIYNWFVFSISVRMFPEEWPIMFLKLNPFW